MSDMQEDLIKTVDRVVADACSKAVRDSAENGQWPQALWQALEDVGLPKALLDETAGGVGLGFTDAMLILRRSAYHGVPVPLAETMLAGRSLAAAGLDVPEGPLTVALAAPGADLAWSGSVSAPVVSGTAPRVPWGAQCEMAVVAGELDGRAMIGLVRCTDANVSEQRNLAGEPRVSLQFNGASLVAAAELALAPQRLHTDGALFRTVQMAGALERALQHALDYASERITFGRPIAKFQAVQHMLAVLAGQAAAASAAADMAVDASVDAPDEFAVAAAKARVGEAAGRGAEIAHQIHGAMGFTHEHSLHYVTRRLWSWRDEFGGETWWQARLGRMAAAAGPESLWPMLTRTLAA